MRGHRSSRILATIGSVAVIGSVLLAGTSSVLAATDNRNVFFGTPGSANLVLSPTNTNPGNVTSYELKLENKSSATLTQVRISGGKEAPVSTNVASPPPSPDALPLGATFADFYIYPDSEDQVDCDLTSSTGIGGPLDGLSCPVDNLQFGDYVRIRVLITLDANEAPGNPLVWNAVQMKEGSSTTGANPDVKYAQGNIKVSDASCPDGRSNWFKKLTQVTLDNIVDDGCPQETKVDAGIFDNQGAFLAVGISTAPRDCGPLKLSCFGYESTADLQPGILPPTAPNVLWTITWNWGTDIKKVSPKGVVHFQDNYVSTNSSTYQIIYFKPSLKCAQDNDGNPTGTNCWWKTETDNKTFFRAWVVTSENGGNRGF